MQNDASEMVVPALIVILIVYVIDMALFDLFLCCCTNVCHRQFETQGDARQRMVTVKYDLPVSYIRHNINGRFISRIENGSRVVADYELDYLATALGTTINHLLGKE